MAHRRVVTGGLLFVLSLASLHLLMTQPIGDVIYLASWIWVVPLLERAPGIAIHFPRWQGAARHAYLNLAQLHRACGYSAATSILIRGFMYVQCGFTGYALFRANAPGWVSILALMLLVCLYVAWFSRRRSSILESNAETGSQIARRRTRNDTAGSGPTGRTVTNFTSVSANT